MALLLAEGSDQARKDALQIFESIMREDIPLTYYAVAFDIPLLLGMPDRAKKAAKGVPASRRWSQWRWWDYVIDYYADELSEADLLKLSGPFSNSGCIANYAIGMKALARGDRDKAYRHFSEVRETHCVAWSPYHWGKAFAGRLEDDDNWPDWIRSDQPKEWARH